VKEQADTFEEKYVKYASKVEEEIIQL